MSVQACFWCEGQCTLQAIGVGDGGLKVPAVIYSLYFCCCCCCFGLVWFGLVCVDPAYLYRPGEIVNIS